MEQITSCKNAILAIDITRADTDFCINIHADYVAKELLEKLSMPDTLAGIFFFDKDWDKLGIRHWQTLFNQKFKGDVETIALLNNLIKDARSIV